MEIKEEYSKLKDKYNLPDFQEIDDEFEISLIDSEVFLLREIRRKISERFNKFSKILESILQPEAVISDMQECHIFNEEEKNKVYSLFKKFMFFRHLSTEASIECTDESNADFINSAFEEWNKMKPEIKDIVQKLRECWKKDTSIHEVLNYMG